MKKVLNMSYYSSGYRTRKCIGEKYTPYFILRFLKRAKVQMLNGVGIVIKNSEKLTAHIQVFSNEPF